MRGRGNWVSNWMEENPEEAIYVCRLGLIRALGISYREAIWMEQNVPLEMIFYQQYLSSESIYIENERKKLAKKRGRQRHGR